MKKILLLASILLLGLPSFSQITKNIILDGNSYYTDIVKLKEGEPNAEIIVKIAFDQVQNKINVSLMSYEQLFVFYKDTKYKNAFSSGKFHPEKLSYVIVSNADVMLNEDKQLKHQVKEKGKKSFVFKKWFTTNDNLAADPKEYQLINDYIEQDFTLTENAENASITLKDVVVLKRLPNKKKDKSVRYAACYVENLNREYKITIQRDPCATQKDEIAKMQQRAKNIDTDFKILSGKCYSDQSKNSDKVISEFEDFRTKLINKYQENTSENNCEEMQKLIAAFNKTYDDIAKAECVGKKKREKNNEPQSQKSCLITREYLTSVAKEIDRSVTRWQLSSNESEKTELANLCKRKINEVNAKINGSNESCRAKFKKEIAAFHDAESYFRSTCK